MEHAWKVLVAAGLPDGPVRNRPQSVDLAALRIAVVEIARAATSIEPARREPLLAWLRGWRAHWPDSFVETLGVEGPLLIEAMTAGVDENRYLKLRRIAIENLSGAL